MCIFEFDEEKYRAAEREAEADRLCLLIKKMTETEDASKLSKLAEKSFLKQMCEKYQV